MVASIIFDWAERTPHKIAIVQDGEPWSYRTFAGAIAAARGACLANGCSGGGVAALPVWNLREFWVLSLALRSLGMTTIAPWSVQAMDGLRLPDLRCVVTSAEEPIWPGLAEYCAARGWPVRTIAWRGTAPVAPDRHAVAGGHILQTSGTTNRHKLVLMDPACELGFIGRRGEINGIGPDSVIAMFDFGGWTGVGYKCPITGWLRGATVVNCQQAERHVAFRHPGLTHATIVPDMLAAILAAPAGAFPRSETLRLAITGGTVTAAQIADAKARITPHLFNRLGPTETNSYGNTPLDSADDHRWHRVIPGAAMELVDDEDRPVPMGEVGRVRLPTAGGPTSYLHDPEATRSFFKDGYFYPGDLAVMRADGRFALEGRVTSVLNVSGQKISPEPIEDRLRAALGVSGVCLVTMQDETGEEQLHVVIEAAAPLPAERLGAMLGAALHGFPAARIYYAESLPRNPMGKLLRDAVRELITAVGPQA